MGAIAPNTPTLGGGPSISCSAAPPLPSGLSIDPNTCVISGTPTAAAAQATYTITAKNNAGSNTTTVTITVNAAQAPTPARPNTQQPDGTIASQLCAAITTSPT